MQQLTAADYITVPWKNGLGTTQQLASSSVAPDHSKSVDFQWRISIADMVENAEFSIFPGIDRILTVIEGLGVTLTSSGSVKPLSCMPFKPTPFSGEEVYFGKLLDGPVKNFNVMCSRELAEANVCILETPCTLSLAGDINFFYVPVGCGLTIFNDGQTTIKAAGGDSIIAHSTRGCDVEILPKNAMHARKCLYVSITAKSN